MDRFLAPTPFFDYDHPRVDAWIHSQLDGVTDDPITQVQHLYVAVRDDIRYNPYVFQTNPSSFKASDVLSKEESYCIPKAVLLGAAARAIGIPSRLGLADVRNHLSSPRLIEFLQSDVFRMHGYIELLINGKWVKATPAFNAALCDTMNVEPLEFDGYHDSVFQAYTASGDAHMEYVADHGVFEDVPHEFIVSGIRSAYGHLFSDEGLATGFSGSLESDVADERSASPTVT